MGCNTNTISCYGIVIIQHAITWPYPAIYFGDNTGQYGTIYQKYFNTLTPWPPHCIVMANNVKVYLKNMPIWFAYFQAFLVAIYPFNMLLALSTIGLKTLHMMRHITVNVSHGAIFGYVTGMLRVCYKTITPLLACIISVNLYKCFGKHTGLTGYLFNCLVGIGQ